MSKVVLQDIGSGYNLQTVVNNNNDFIEEAFDNTLSRNGDAPNTMGASIDMGTNPIINLGSPVNSTSAARWIDVTEAVDLTGLAAPTLTGNEGKSLTNDGTSLVWENKAPYYERSPEEITAGLTPVDFTKKWGHVRRWGALGDSSTDDSDAINDAIAVGGTVYFDDGDYRANNLVGSTDKQQFIGEGAVYIRKNGDGPLFTHSGDDIYISNIDFRGESNTPVFTGDNILLTGERPTLSDCSSQWAVGRALKATKNRVRVLGSRGIYHTSDATATGYDIEIGESGTATLYHVLQGFNTSHANGGFLFIDCGGQTVNGCQFGKLTIQSGTSPAGVNGGNYSASRILGDITVEISSAVFSGNTIGDVDVTFETGTSGHRFDESNALSASAVLVDDSNVSHVVDSRLVPFQAYTPTLSAVGGSPAIGNGTLVGYYSKVGLRVSGFINMTYGTTTNPGTGAWFFSLPAIPTTSGLQCSDVCMIIDSGTTNYAGVSIALSDGTARIQAQAHGTATRVGLDVPHVWAAGDELRIKFDYFTD
jgi:hypothetical protein